MCPWGVFLVLCPLPEGGCRRAYASPQWYPSPAPSTVQSCEEPRRLIPGSPRQDSDGKQRVEERMDATACVLSCIFFLPPLYFTQHRYSAASVCRSMQLGVPPLCRPASSGGLARREPRRRSAVRPEHARAGVAIDAEVMRVGVLGRNGGKVKPQPPPPMGHISQGYHIACSRILHVIEVSRPSGPP